MLHHNTAEGLPETPTLAATRRNGLSCYLSRLSLLAKACLGIRGTHGVKGGWIFFDRSSRDIKSFCAYSETEERHIAAESQVRCGHVGDQGYPGFAGQESSYQHFGKLHWSGSFLFRASIKRPCRTSGLKNFLALINIAPFVAITILVWLRYLTVNRADSHHSTDIGLVNTAKVNGVYSRRDWGNQNTPLQRNYDAPVFPSW